MNRIDQAFEEKGKDLLNVFFTAGHPQLDDTLRVARALEAAGADIIEIGMPYSDPIGEGPTIQESSSRALANGMTIRVLFDQIKALRKEVTVPVLLMGYINPVLQYGIDNFCKKCKEVGIDGLIIPDLPMYEYELLYKELFEECELYNVFLVTPQTSEERIRRIDELTQGFIYMVSDDSITGAKKEITPGQLDYFHRVASMNLKNKRLIGFGISSRETFRTACQYADGAVIGSAFIRQLMQDASDPSIHTFIQSIKG